jgi:SAM-dependent methyltransferase
VSFSEEKDGGFRSSHFKQLFDIEAGNFWFQSRNRLIIWALQRNFPRARKFLEIGCGTGFVLSGIKKRFPSLLLYGGDIYGSGLNYARKRLGEIDLFQMDVRKIPFKDEFDVIGAFDILEHISEDELAIAQIHKALRNNGGMILTVPQHKFLWSATDKRDCHVRRYNVKELCNKVEGFGFKVLDIISFNSLLLPLMIVDRFFKKTSREKCSSIEELRINKIANIVLGDIMNLEFLLVRLGIRLSFGGSLLLIARK